MPTYGFP
jgi:hypothetical protein